MASNMGAPSVQPWPQSTLPLPIDPLLLSLVSVSVPSAQSSIPSLAPSLHLSHNACPFPINPPGKCVLNFIQILFCPFLNHIANEVGSVECAHSEGLDASNGVSQMDGIHPMSAIISKCDTAKAILSHDASPGELPPLSCANQTRGASYLSIAVMPSPYPKAMPVVGAGANLPAKIRLISGLNSTTTLESHVEVDVDY
ncbi:hypothetical protein Nepgr_017961 [Nepenthes gracilis]|uniref:Uncharacterized protein n=1 Tax=Nepenthes gracilis TaxID=150966 RepID=A0AAD3SSF7_NEPGR|nr:hypothetical protein Nepgr_017961 [Nepenthes gracilis]